MKIAIDSLPLKHSLSQSTDYSGIQFFSLSESTLAETEIFENGSLAYESRLPKNFQWDDGTAITGHDFMMGFKKLFAERPFLKQILFKDLRSIECNTSSIRFYLKKKNRFFPEILRLPFLTPNGLGKQRSSGTYRLISQNTNTFTFRKQRKVSGPEEVVIHHIQNPNENVQAFLKGELDITSDTALPLGMDFTDLPIQKRNTGLFAGIEISKRLIKNTTREQRKYLQSLIGATSFQHIHFGKYDSWTVTSNETPISRSMPMTLVLAYDDFYPNKEVCETIQQTLVEAGFTVNLVVDNYYMPFQNFDLKFVIRRGLGPHAYFRYLSLISDPGLRENKMLLKSFAHIYASWESADINDVGATFLCDRLLKEAASFIPLFKIPSLSLNKTLEENPLLKYLK